MRDVGKILPVILAGETPLEAGQACPHHLQKRRFGQSLLQNTVGRFDSDLFYRPIFITTEDQRDVIETQVADLGVDIGAMIIEPEGRGTAACAIIAALLAETYGPETLVLLSPSDQHVHYPQAFRRSIAATIPVANDGYIATFGMTPSYAETDYAYIRKGEPLRPGTFLVDDFVEKPDEKSAKALVKTGAYFWNAGTFLFRPDTLIASVEPHKTELIKHCRVAFETAAHEDGVIRLKKEPFLKCEKASFDKAIMEHIENRALIPAHIGWSDRGDIMSSPNALNAIDIAS